jgi:hypothetical protein
MVHMRQESEKLTAEIFLKPFGVLRTDMTSPQPRVLP